MWRWALLAWLLSAPLAAAAVLEGRCYDAQLSNATLDGQLDRALICQGVPWQLLFRELWAPVTLVITCPTGQYTIVEGRSEEDLASKLGANKAVFWCGYSSLHDGRVCSRTIGPIADTFVGVKLRRQLIEKRACQYDVLQERSPWLPALLIAGVLLFFNARLLSTSQAFRLSVGSGTFALGAVLILTFVLVRSVPQRGRLMATLATIGGTMAGSVHWLFGTWIPSLSQLIQSPFFLSYIGAMSLVGLAVTYYFDDTSNAKLNTIIEVALQLLGLALVLCSTTVVEVSAVAAALCVLLQVLWRPMVASWLALVRAKPHSQRRKDAVTPPQPSTPTRSASLDDWLGYGQGGLTSHTSGTSSQPWPGSSPLGSQGHTAEMPSQLCPGSFAPGSRPLSGRSHTQGAPGQPSGSHASGPSGADSPPRSGWARMRWRASSPREDAAATAAAAAAAAAKRRPIHLRQRPPRPGGSPAPSPPTSPLPPPPLVAPRLERLDFRQIRRQQLQQQPQQQQQQQTAATPAEQQPRHELPPPPLPFAPLVLASTVSEDQDRMYIAPPPPPSPPASLPSGSVSAVRAPPLGTGSPPHRPLGPLLGAGSPPQLPAEQPQLAPSPQQVSPLVEQGKIFNQATGRTIQIGKAKYNELVQAGYVADLQQGVLLPPGSARR